MSLHGCLGRPVIERRLLHGQRLVLNAGSTRRYPTADRIFMRNPGLNNSDASRSTADRLGVENLQTAIPAPERGRCSTLSSTCVIPLRAGTDLIKTLGQ